MPSFIDIPTGKTPAAAADIQQVIDALKGTAGKGVPLSPTAVADAIAYALSVKNTDATNSRAAIFYGADGNPMLSVDKNGVQASAYGTNALAPVVTTSQSQTLTNKTLSSPTISGPIGGTVDVSSATSVKGVPQLNQLMNGGFEIWQRGGGPFTASGAYTADRWATFLAGTDTLSVSYDAANIDAASGGSAACTFVLGTGAGATSLSQTLKVADGSNARARTVSVSARIKTATAGAVNVVLSSDGTGGTIHASAAHSGSNNYETLTASLAIPSDATHIVVAIGFVVSCTAYVDNTTLVTGSVPMDYVPQAPADDLARCLRYYLRFPAGGSNNIVATLQATSATLAYGRIPWPAPLGGLPTLTLSAVSDFNLWTASGALQACTGLSVFGTGPRAGINATVASGLVAGNAANLVTANTNAWLAFEWNP